MIKKFLISVTLIFSILFIAEITLRFFGYIPGVFKYYEGFDVVDSLIVYKNFTTDDHGIYKFSPWITDSVPKYFNPAQESITNKEVRQQLSMSDQFDYVFSSYSILKNSGSKSILNRYRSWIENEEWNTEFPLVYRNLDTSPAFADTTWQQLMRHYVKHPFNTEGFRSIPFDRHNSDRPRILMIGDSFVYGMSARPFFNSYPDILLSRGYLIYNTGIPGTDPAQYAAIAEKYVPKLKPDLVVLNFFPGNDVMNFPREPHPDKPIEHMTNAGYFYSDPMGEYLDAYNAYLFYKSLVSIPDSGRLNQLSSQLVITSLLWKIFYEAGEVEQPILQAYDKFRNTPSVDAIELTKSYLNRINFVCEQHQIPLLNVVIPYRFADYNSEKEYIIIDEQQANKLFGSRNYVFNDNLQAPVDFYRDNYHFNNSGSLKFADFLQLAIDSSLNRNY